MNKTKIILPIFIVVVLVQLYVPFKMIWNKNDILKTGKEFKFKTMPIDPNDPFRGKYIDLRYTGEFLIMETNKEFEHLKYGDDVFVEIINDSEGYAMIKNITTKKIQGSNYVTAKLDYDEPSRNDSTLVSIKYPFNRFYMEESKAPKAEKLYNETIRDTSKITYGLVSIKDGDAVLKDVCIDGVSIRELVKNK